MIDILDLKSRIGGLRQQIHQCVISLATSIDKIGEIANELFGEERVDYNPTHDYIIIHFPEIEITNSRDQRHTIHDIYVKLIIQNEAQRRKVYIRGTRSSITTEEFDSSYSHSHLESGSYHGAFRDFCIGTGPFFEVTQRVKEYGTSDIDNWYLYLYNIPSYLSWESLQGGPYIRMEEIRAAGLHTPDIVNRILPGITKELPTSCLYFNEGEVQIDLASPAIRELYDRHFARLTTSGYISEEKQRRYTSAFTSFIFKGERVVPRIIPSLTTSSAIRTPVAIINALNMQLSERINKFNKTFIHDINKSLYDSRLGEVPVLQSSQVNHL